MPESSGYQNRVWDTSTTSGTGTLTLANSPPAGYMSFGSAFVTGQRVYYKIDDGTNWEVGIGTFASSGPTLSRDTVLSSYLAAGPTFSQALISWGGGTLQVWCDLPSETLADRGMTVAMMQRWFSQ